MRRTQRRTSKMEASLRRTRLRPPSRDDGLEPTIFVVLEPQTSALPDAEMWEGVTRHVMAKLAHDRMARGCEVVEIAVRLAPAGRAFSDRDARRAG